MLSLTSPSHVSSSPGASIAPGLKNHARAMRKRMELFAPTQIATEDGRLFEALAISGAGLPQHEWPLDVIGPSVDVEDALRGDDLVRSIDEDTDHIERLAAWPLTDLGLDRANPPNRVEALAKLIGYTEAVPFQQPRPTERANEWYCIGGEVTQFDTTFHVESVRLTVNAAEGGFVGLKMNVTVETGFIGRVVLAAVTAGGFGEAPVTELFLPLWVLCPDGAWLPWTLQLPRVRNVYWWDLTPSGPSGTLLSS